MIPLSVIVCVSIIPQILFYFTDIYYNTQGDTEENKSTQLIFSDLGVPHDDGGFNIYDDIKSKLISKGVPENEIKFIHDAKNEAAKDKLFADVRAGNVRVLIGSTQKMGAGTNVRATRS